jgi:hypothetical protein
MDADDTLIVAIGTAFDEAARDGAVDEPDCAVVLQQQCIGDVADGGFLRPGVASDREQQLVLGRCQTDGVGLRLAPVEELAQSGTELQQALIVEFRKCAHGIYRSTI